MSDWLEEVKRRQAASAQSAQAFQSSMTQAAGQQNPYAVDYNSGFRPWNTQPEQNSTPVEQTATQRSVNPVNAAATANNAYQTANAVFGGGSSAAASQAITDPAMAAAANNAPAAAAPGLAGIIAGAYTGLKQGQGIKNVVKGRDLSTTQQAALFLPTFGTSVLYNPVKNLFKSKTREEEHRRDALAKQGIVVPEDPNDPNGKRWELNPEFAATRDESKLKGSDISDAAWFYANIPDYGKLNAEQKAQIAQGAIDRGLVREHHGTIDVTTNEDYQTYVTGILSTPTSTVDVSRLNSQIAAESRAARKQAMASQILNIASQNQQNALSTIANKPSSAQAVAQTAPAPQDVSSGFANFEQALSNILLK